MQGTPIDSTVREAAPAAALAFPTHAQGHAGDIIEHLVRRAVLAPESPVAGELRSILNAPPEALRVGRIARRLYVARRTLGRHFRVVGLPAPNEWVGLARALLAHRTIARGGPLKAAAAAAGYPDQFTMSNAIHRITGLRPSQLRDVSWTAFLDVWIARQREHGTMTGPPRPESRPCPLCGSLRAS